MGKEKLFIDGSKLEWHTDWVKKWLSGENVFPIHVEISPSSGCNHRCTLCCVDYKKHKRVDLSPEVMRRIPRDFQEAGVKSFLLAGEGEPLLNRYCEDLLLESKQRGIDAAITSNGVLFTPKLAESVLDCLSWTRFSMQAASPDLYSEIHRTKKSDFYRVVENIRNAVRIKNERGLDGKIGIQQILINENIGEVLDMAKLSKEIGVDYYTVKRFSKHKNNSYDVPEEWWKGAVSQFTEAEKLSDEKFSVQVRWNQFVNQPRSYTRCIGLPAITQILASGEIYPCCQFFDNSEMSYGDMNKQTFKEIFESTRAKKIMKFIEEKYDLSGCMTYCRHHSTNIVLTAIRENPGSLPDTNPSGEPPEHKNFI